MLETFRENKLFCKRSKCEFGVRDVLFLGHRIDGMHISPNPKKLQAHLYAHVSSIYSCELKKKVSFSQQLSVDLLQPRRPKLLLKRVFQCNAAALTLAPEYSAGKNSLV